MREAPVHRVVERASGLWLELTADPLGPIPEVSLARLQAYLGPITPTVEEIRVADRLPAVHIIATTLADAYAGYTGAPLEYETLPLVEAEALGIHLRFKRAPREQARKALVRAVQRWYEDGVDGAFGPGALHYVSDPRWDSRAARWTVDLGDVNIQGAIDELMRRLAGWSNRWNAELASVHLGTETG